MKKLIIITIFLVVILFIFSDSNSNNKESNDMKELRGVFISYIEEGEYLETDYDKSKHNIDLMIDNLIKNKFNLVILQVRSFSDSIYPSNIYPFSKIINGEEGIEYFDVLNYFIKKCHSNNIKLYAWINPYRIRSSLDIESISSSNPAYQYLNTDTLYINDGIYYNPSKREVEDLIVNGIEEIVTNYKVDGIIFDDYFYPSNDCDLDDYNLYISKNDYISIEEYHLMIVNRLIKRVHDVCSKKNILFGVSPDGNINNNYTSIYADIYKWLSDEDYIDFIMPQLYYGFFNSSMPYLDTIKLWNDSIKNDIDLVVALAIYKSGNVDKYAKEGSNEWIDNNNILMREVMLSRNFNHYNGFTLFRYDNIFGSISNNNSLEEFNNLLKIID